MHFSMVPEIEVFFKLATMQHGFYFLFIQMYLYRLLFFYSRTLNSIDLYLLLINSSKLLMAKPIPPCPKQKGPGYHKKPHVIA